MIPYDPSREALLHPGLRPTLFRDGDADVLTVDAVCAECARLAYVRFENGDAERGILREALERIGASDFSDFDANGTQAVAVTLPRAGEAGGRYALLAFRGTEPDRLTDFGADLRVSTDAGPRGGVVHAGFLRAFRAVEQQIGDWLALHATGVRVFTGHSLGAALATLAAARWPGARLITFGSPRVGDEDFGATVGGEVTRYVDCCDIVCRVPPETPWYTHVAPSAYIDRDGVLGAASPEAAAADRAAARVDYLEKFAWRTGTVLVRDLADHAPINYVRALIGDR